MEQVKKELLEIILGIKSDHKQKGTLQLALNSARFYCGYMGGNYSLKDFKVRQGYIEKVVADCDLTFNSEEGDLFSSLYLYLNCIEQIGNLFYSSEKGNAIRKAIESLTPNILSHDEITAIKALRNALAHRLGLMGTVKDEKRKSLFFKFSLHFSERSDNKILKLPLYPWNGDFKDKREETSTMVYVFNFIKMAETVIANARKAFQDQKLVCLLPIEELETRYTILIDESKSI